MNQQKIENQMIRSSRIEACISILSLIAVVVGYFFFQEFRSRIGWGGAVVWGAYVVLYLSQRGAGRSWLGASLPIAVAFFFLTWALGG